ncbi:Uncharacterised protein [Sphingobacterium multivorum]|uniref:Uncharacterized protein n=1 Tax=Sphingobacterium multivorum TaxID=28454 RepID=A0A2X2KM74_SPHMU|nr:Uncharacterised protein [Sphingobacterium multivorum]
MRFVFLFLEQELKTMNAININFNIFIQIIPDQSQLFSYR